MGTQQSTEKKQQDKHPFNKDTKESAVKKETDQSSFAKLPTPTSPDDLNHSKSKDLTGNLNNTATTSQGLGPSKLISHSVEPSNGKEAIFTKMHQVPAVDVPQNRAKESTDGPLQKARTVAARDVGTRATEDCVHNSDVSASVQVLCKHASPQEECSFGSKEQQEMLPQNTSTRPGVAEVPASTPTEPPNHSTQMSNQPNTQDEENALQEPGLNHNNATNVILVHRHYLFWAKSEKSRANAARMRLRQKLANKLKAQPQDGSKSSQQTFEETVTVQESSQQQGCTAMEAKKHQEPQQIPQCNKDDYDTNGSPSSCIQKVNEKADEQRPAAAPNITATHHPTTATADANVKLRLQCQLKVSLPQDTAVKPKKKCTFTALNQNQPKENTGNIAIEEKLNGNNVQVGKEKPETANTPVQSPEQEVHTEGCWHPFTVNLSCPSKARCRHNAGTGLPPNVQKWFDDCPNYLRAPPSVNTAKLGVCSALREMQEEGGDSHP